MDQKKIGQFIGQRRKEREMTQKQLADEIGVSDKTISKWETGNGLPDILSLDALCKALEINVNELLSGEKLPPETYSEKAEENIMHLLEEKENTKKFYWMEAILGALLLIFALWGTFVSIYGLNFSAAIIFLDMPSFLFVVIPATGATLLSGVRTVHSFAAGMRKCIMPCAVFATVQGLITVWNNMSEFDAWVGPSMAVAMIPLFYAAFLYLICWVVEERTGLRDVATSVGKSIPQASSAPDVPQDQA